MLFSFFICSSSEVLEIVDWVKQQQQQQQQQPVRDLTLRY